MNDEDLEQILATPSDRSVSWRNFDHEWYLRAHPDLRSKIDGDSFDEVRRYYLAHGRLLGHSPNMFFDEAWYRLRYPDIEDEIAAGDITTGYEHYCALGYLERSPHWLYDDAIYALFSQDLTDAVLAEYACFNRYDHYIKSGARENRIAHLLFDPATYRHDLESQGEETAAIDATSPFVHFLRRIWYDSKDAATSIYFDRAWYLARHPDARIAMRRRQYACALQHYLTGPDPASRDPLPQFSESYYRDRYPDIVAAIQTGAVASGYEHFLRAGALDLRNPSPDLDLRGHLAQNPQAQAEIDAGTSRNAFEHLLRHGYQAGMPPTDAALVDAALADRPLAEPARPGPAVPTIAHGRIDFLGFHTAAHGWIFCGWASPEHAALDGSTQVTAIFDNGEISGPALISTYVREDLAGMGVGVLLFIEGSGRTLGNLVSLRITVAEVGWTLLPSENAAMPRDADLIAQLRPVLGRLRTGPSTSELVTLATRRGYTGANTMGELHDRMFLEIDETILCPPNDLLLVGWMLAPAGVVKSIRLQCGAKAAVLHPERFLRLERPDVVNSVGAKFGLGELRNGFMAHVPDVYVPGDTTYLAVETMRGEVGFRGITEPKLRGMPAIRFMLERFDIRYNEVARCFDDVVGPAVASLNRERMRQGSEREVIDFGDQPAAPVLSVIVPLYGRLDFMEYQFAIFSRHASDFAHEFIYVLDDPAKQREAEVLAASIHARFAIPFRLILLAHNLGYAPANNIGLGLARGDYICLLNSDVLPDTDDWMERLVARLQADPRLGAVGPLLLFEDRSVQHQGMLFERLPEFGNWQFPIHERKGWRPPAERGLRRCAAITGACMVIEASRLRAHGGLDESYVIGDFEDSDLCMKLAEQDLDCAVDLDVTLYHLERQSQAGSAQRWRMNLTLYNAWVHEQRWAARLRELGERTASPQRKARPAPKSRHPA